MQETANIENYNEVAPGKRLRDKKWYQLVNDHFEEVFIAIGFAIFIILVNAQVINRYVLPFIEIANITTWTGEVARYTFIWISYFGASLTIKKREAIKVDILLSKLPNRGQGIVNLANSLFMLIFCYFLITHGGSMIQSLVQTKQTSPALGIPMYLPYAAVPVGFILIGLRILQSMFEDFRSIYLRDLVYVVLFAGVLTLPMVWIGAANVPLMLFGYFAIFILIGVPIAFALGIATLASVLTSNAIPLSFFPQAAFTSIDNFPIMAIPFFVAAGIIMGTGDLINRLLRLSDNLVGFLTGGLALVAVFTSMFFSAISGSGPATVAAIGTLLIPAMIKQGYGAGFSTAIIAAAGSIGVIIPPSTPFIIYGVVAQSSISQLFIAGIVPGIICGVSLCIIAYVISKKNGWGGKQESFSIKKVGKSAWEAKLALLVPVIILGGIYGGIMTPTEAAAVAAGYGIIIGMVVYRDINFKGLYHALVKAGITSSVIILLIIMATIFGRLISVERITESVASFVTGVSDNPIIILLLLNGFLLLVGLVLEALAAIVILTPILLPIAESIGMDPVHFGVMLIFNLAIGFITPPVGVNLFVASGVAKIKIEEVIKKIAPFLITMAVVLLVVTYIPDVSLWLVDRMR